jgi:hypothetical protein
MKWNARNNTHPAAFSQIGGNHRWRAPESFPEFGRHVDPDPAKADVYSLGGFLYALLTVSAPEGGKIGADGQDRAKSMESRQTFKWQVAVVPHFPSECQASTNPVQQSCIARRCNVFKHAPRTDRQPRVN